MTFTDHGLPSVQMVAATAVFSHYIHGIGRRDGQSGRTGWMDGWTDGKMDDKQKDRRMTGM